LVASTGVAHDKKFRRFRRFRGFRRFRRFREIQLNFLNL